VQFDYLYFFYPEEYPILKCAISICLTLAGPYTKIFPLIFLLQQIGIETMMMVEKPSSILHGVMVSFLQKLYIVLIDCIMSVSRPWNLSI
jgi:hypothetical protein